MPGTKAFEHSWLENDLECELNLPFWDGRLDQDTRSTAGPGQRCSRPIEDVGIAIAWALASFSTWVGLLLGGWMRKVQR